MSRPLVGNTPLHISDKEVSSDSTMINGEKFYKIENYNHMPPFFMSIVSDSDHWMFISSSGGLTAGRKDAENALFPYYTDDKITDSAEITGNKSVFIVERNAHVTLWEPFSERYKGVYAITRNLYKSVYGNKLIFEEINHDLSLSFRYSWSNSERFGFVKTSELRNLSVGAVSISLLDGIQNILPYGVTTQLQTEYSTLLNAYKKNELHPNTPIGIYSLSSILTDRAEPSEALKATLVWSAGLPGAKYLLSSAQVDKFRLGWPVEQENDVRAARGAYFLNDTIELGREEVKKWYIAADINCDMRHLVATENFLKNNKDAPVQIEADIAKGTANLIRIVANADGLQISEDEPTTMRHFSNVLFNVMRGGIFDNNYTVDKADFTAYIKHFNPGLASADKEFLDKLPANILYSELLGQARDTGNPDLFRLCLEYMPLTFSRRHGDPSRPWNQFSIQTKNEDGSKVLYYQGNWRDIFQNWEALSLSFPEFIESMISKFVNASTVDGYNSYRITRDGIDWEVVEPENPWSNIGYWGDHQIIYLLKLLEISAKFHPGRLNGFLSQEVFTYANVPYRIKAYADLLKDPQDTILFDHQAQAKIEKRVAQHGADGKLVWDKEGNTYKANLTEKLLVTVLAKMSNFIPEAGVWLNTQRPEWNDANNALVGNGVSMVTLYYMRRYLAFCRKLLAASGHSSIRLSAEVRNMLLGITQTLQKHKPLLADAISDTDRKTIMDALGKTGEQYRNSVYQGFSETKPTASMEDILAFMDISLEYIDHSIKANKREDNLYHAYNLMKVGTDKNAVSVSHLYEMLEGQVAVLSSGALSAEEALAVMDALRKSKMFSESQFSYTLYPDRQRPLFAERNNIPKEMVEKSALLQEMLKNGDTQVVTQDENGVCHFNSAFKNAKDLKAALEHLQNTPYAGLAKEETQLLLDIFEEIFDHRSFTGRSGTFYGYEGLGCIYWHMVSKLVLAIEENCLHAAAQNADADTFGKLVNHYYEARAGIGLGKSPDVYGAFPTDPYSHTPGNAGVKQPGMTGQVKEDILSRFGELGVNVHNGKLYFDPLLLRSSEFLKEATTFSYYDAANQKQTLPLAAGKLAFTYCQVPVVYTVADNHKITVTLNNGGTKEFTGLSLDSATSEALFTRNQQVAKIEVALTPGLE